MHPPRARPARRRVPRALLTEAERAYATEPNLPQHYAGRRREGGGRKALGSGVYFTWKRSDPRRPARRVSERQDAGMGEEGERRPTFDDAAPSLQPPSRWCSSREVGAVDCRGDSRGRGGARRLARRLMERPGRRSPTSCCAVTVASRWSAAAAQRRRRPRARVLRGGADRAGRRRVGDLDAPDIDRRCAARDRSRDAPREDAADDRLVNGSGCPVVAVDVPSGVNAAID